MQHSEQEIEAKFFIRNLDPMNARLQSLGVQLTSQRVLEIHLRFDTPDNAISRQVLRRCVCTKRSPGCCVPISQPKH